MKKTDVQGVLIAAQKLLWGGSETENIAAHNMIAKLITDLEKDELDTANII
jgi:hypothetical protein